jgi:hypothetical protein
MGSQALIEDAVVRHTSPRQYDQEFGRGVVAQSGCALDGYCNPEADSAAQLRRVLIEDNYDIGVYVMGSAATIETSVVRRTQARPDGAYGDGIAVTSEVAPGSLDVSLVHVEDSARAGISNFGALVAIGSTVVQCASFDLEGEAQGQAFTFEDRGGNRCGCPVADAECIAVSPGLEPPGAIGD